MPSGMLPFIILYTSTSLSSSMVSICISVYSPVSIVARLPLVLVITGVSCPVTVMLNVLSLILPSVADARIQKLLVISLLTL